MAFNPSDYGWTDQDVLNAFVSDPEWTANYANEHGISAEDLADWANTVEGTTGDWTADAINQTYGINYASSASDTGTTGTTETTNDLRGPGTGKAFDYIAGDAFDPTNYGWGSDQDFYDAIKEDVSGVVDSLNKQGVSATDIASYFTSQGWDMSPSDLVNLYGMYYTRDPSGIATLSDGTSLEITNEELMNRLGSDPKGTGKWLAKNGASALDLQDWGISQGYDVPLGDIHSSFGLSYTHDPSGIATFSDGTSLGITNEGLMNFLGSDPEGAGDWLTNMGASAIDLQNWGISQGYDVPISNIQSSFGLSLSPPINLYQPYKYPLSYSGMDKQYLDQIMQTVMPEFKKSITNLNSNVSKYFEEAKNYNTKQGTDLLQGILQQQTNSLASRNILNSSIASTALGNATGEVLKNINNQNMQLGMQEAKAKTDLPSALGQLLQYGKVSTWSDPSAPIKNLLSLF